MTAEPKEAVMNQRQYSFRQRRAMLLKLHCMCIYGTWIFMCFFPKGKYHFVPSVSESLVIALDLGMFAIVIL